MPDPSPAEPAPRTKEEINRWAHERRPHEREPVPQPGERVLFRQHDFGDTSPAVVDAVQDMTDPGSHRGPHPPRPGDPPDWNVWEQDEVTGVVRLKEDPWPWVAVRVADTAEDGTETLRQPQWCKESRVRGSPGWLRHGSCSHTGQYESGE